MKKDSLLAEILNAIVGHERHKVKTQKPDYYLNQKKQLWYGLMNQLDEETPPPEGGEGKGPTPPPSGSASGTPGDSCR